jgi:hypothetical protein
MPWQKKLKNVKKKVETMYLQKNIYGKRFEKLCKAQFPEKPENDQKISRSLKKCNNNEDAQPPATRTRPIP